MIDMLLCLECWPSLAEMILSIKDEELRQISKRWWTCHGCSTDNSSAMLHWQKYNTLECPIITVCNYMQQAREKYWAGQWLRQDNSEVVCKLIIMQQAREKYWAGQWLRQGNSEVHLLSNSTVCWYSYWGFKRADMSAWAVSLRTKSIH